MLVRSFSTSSRPALRAAASGGRPHAGSTTRPLEPHVCLAQGPVKVEICTKCPSMLQAGLCPPTWVNAAI